MSHGTQPELSFLSAATARSVAESMQALAAPSRVSVPAVPPVVLPRIPAPIQLPAPPKVPALPKLPAPPKVPAL